MTSPTTTAAPVIPTFQCDFSIEIARGGCPVLFISFKCPHCRKVHHHTWGLHDDGREEWGAYRRAPHCPGLHGPGPHRYYPHDYLITPARTSANEATYRRYAELLRAHQRRAARPSATNPTVT